ncbi:RasGEF domain protein (macronuclear) [Tetrahymena thermophila SB210]|uniref:RasGEF domain protein n=1 Tax=Tetrahymena thermophila (strain SB210) TaxID=312017 RepID=I7MIM5_TETTS|nr:RasGEF domain protein [Tetrahymena thermophila SB210]EAS04580.2 RasGEF domain protein [Tetrahymena thermophila SB210]|eukprot:XP_001024825.2 RasGEF domain protein [Tetrahymena thermophila SB210]
MSEMINQKIKPDVDLHSYYKMRTKGKKFSLEFNQMSYTHGSLSENIRDGLILSNQMKTINESDEFNQSKINEAQNQFLQPQSDIFIGSSESHLSQSANEDQMNSKIRLLNNKKQSMEIGIQNNDMFNDTKCNSSTTHYNPEMHSKIKKTHKIGTKSSRSLDYASKYKNNYNYIRNFLVSGQPKFKNKQDNCFPNQQINQQQFDQNDCSGENIQNLNTHKKKRKYSHSIDEILWKSKHQSLASQLEFQNQKKLTTRLECQSSIHNLLKSKLAQFKMKRASSDQSQMLTVIEIMEQFYSRQAIKNINQNELDISYDFNTSCCSNSITPQFFTEETAAKYILKLFKNRNFLKKNYLEEIHKSKEGHIQFKECCLEGKCAANGNKTPHVNKIKCMHKYLLLYRAFQDEQFFNELVINTYDFLISNHELFTQMVCFFFFNDNVSFNRQFKCLEFCLKWISKRPFTFQENSDLFYKMKEFVQFIKLKYCSFKLSENGAAYQKQASPCKCDSFLKQFNFVNNPNDNQEQIYIIQKDPLTIQSPIKLLKQNFSTPAMDEARSYEFYKLKNLQQNKSEAISHPEYNLRQNSIGSNQNSYFDNRMQSNDFSVQNSFNNINNNNSYNSIPLNNIKSESNNNSNNNDNVNSNNYDSTHVSLASRSEKRRGPPPALARYNNTPNQNQAKKLLSKIILNQNSSSPQKIQEEKQIEKSQQQIQSFDSKTTSIPFIKDSRGATSSIYCNSQATAACTFTNQGENVIFSQTESSAHINTFKSLFSERKESQDLLQIPQFKGPQVKSMLINQTQSIDEFSSSYNNKTGLIYPTNLSASLYLEQQSSNNLDNNYLSGSNSMSKSHQPPQKQYAKLSQLETKQNHIQYKDGIKEEEIIESQESSYISSQSSSVREKSYSASQLTLVVQSIQQGNSSSNSNGNNSSLKSYQNTSALKLSPPSQNVSQLKQMSPNNSNQQNSSLKLSLNNDSEIKKNKKKQLNKRLTADEIQLQEMSEKIMQIENTLIQTEVKQNDIRLTSQFAQTFKCLSQSQLQQIQDKWHATIRSRFYERLNTQILKEKFSHDIFIQFDIDIIAQQICLIDHSLFYNINIYELFQDKRLKSFNLFTQYGQKKNLNLVKRRFNLFTYFIIFIILLQHSQSETLQMYEKLLHLSERALEYQNYNLCLQIYSSFNSSIIYEKIKQVQQVSSQLTKKRFSVLEKAIEFNRSFHSLKESMSKANPPLVPALNIITRDLTLLDQIKDDFIQVQHQQQIDLVKFEEISKLSQIIFNVKRHKYPFVIYPAVYDFFSVQFERYMAQYIDMKDISTVEFKLSEFAKKSCSSNSSKN